jgi:hypothetical protein
MLNFWWTQWHCDWVLSENFGFPFSSCALEHANIETRLLFERPEFESSMGKKISLPIRPDRLWDPPNLLFKGHRSSFSGAKRQGHDVDKSSPSNAELKNAWSYTPIWHHVVTLLHFTAYNTHRQVSQANPRLLGVARSVVLLRLSKGISRHWSNWHVSWEFVSVSQWPRLTGAPTTRINISHSQF